MTVPWKLSASMRHALALAGFEGKLILRRGGWWTYPSCRVARTDAQGYEIPEEYAPTNTVRALCVRGLLRAVAPGYGADCEITEQGRAALAAEEGRP